MWPIGDCGWHCLLQHSSLAAVEPGSHRAWVQVLDMESNGRQRLSDLSLWFSQEGSLSPCLSTVPFQVTVEGCCTYFQYAPSIQPAAPQTRPHWEKPGRGTLSERQQQRSPLRQGLGPLPLFLQFAMTGLALALPLIHCFHSAAPFSVPRVLDP